MPVCTRSRPNENGFARQAYGERTAGGTGTPLNILAGQVLKDVVFRLIPAGALSGRVVDATGEPLAGITIQIARSHTIQTGNARFNPLVQREPTIRDRPAMENRVRS